MATKREYRQEIKKGERPYWLAVLIALDQLANVMLWGFPDETISSRAYRSAKLDKKPKTRWLIAERLINLLFFWDTDGKKRHCQLAYEGELMRSDFPETKHGH